MPVAPWVWGAFVAFVVGLLALDLLVFHRRPHAPSLREAAAWSIVWVSLGLAFAGVLWVWQGGAAAGEYLAGYVIEESLSVDNLFVFALIFAYFGVPAAYQHRVLFWGILGAIVFRALFIAAGAALLGTFHWIVYLFGAFLVLTGIKVARQQDEAVHPERNPALRLLGRLLPLTPAYHGARLLVRQDGRWWATPLLAVLVVVETTDVLFAVDSIPAIFAVTRDPFLVFTSNAFAILGLRSLYFLLAGLMSRFVYLKVGLGALLVFVGAKMLLSDLYHVPIWASLLVIAAILATALLASLLVGRGREAGPAEAAALPIPQPVPPVGSDPPRPASPEGSPQPARSGREAP
ncbi:MAG TPA: TerC family protein [Chloroflexota bacterium]|nr:TerC family protein [Chloroflexota bacterium]